MKKLAVAAAACGLFSGVATAEPLALSEGELSQVNAGYLNIQELNDTVTKHHRDLAVGLSLYLGGKSVNSVSQWNDVETKDGATVNVNQNATANQTAGVNVSPITIDIPLDLNNGG